MRRIEIGGQGRQEYWRLIDDGAGSTATIYPHVGFNCASFTVRAAGETLDLLYADPAFPAPQAKPTANGSPILAPFPNRIRGGRYLFAGREFSLPVNHGDNAIHGFAFDQPWRVLATRSDPNALSIAGEFQLSVDCPDFASLWPADFRLRCEYRLDGATLETRFDIENVSTDALPFGLGTHPYFRFPLGPNSTERDCTIECPAGHCVELVDCLPTGEVAAVSEDNDLRLPTSWAGRPLDDVFTGLEPDENGNIAYALTDRRAGVRLRIIHPPDFKYCVLFVPPHRKAICIEPYTCVTDAMNLQQTWPDAGLRVLAPGERWPLWIRYEVDVAT